MGANIDKKLKSSCKSAFKYNIREKEKRRSTSIVDNQEFHYK